MANQHWGLVGDAPSDVRVTVISCPRQTSLAERIARWSSPRLLVAVGTTLVGIVPRMVALALFSGSVHPTRSSAITAIRHAYA
jgi:hypothetical protein